MKDIRFTNPFTKEAMKSRLLKEYKAHNGKLVIGIDFDNTIYDTHNVGADFSSVIELVKECMSRNMTICLYTSCEMPIDIERKTRMFEAMFGKKPDYVNFSPLSPNASKPFFNILLDDRAGLQECFEVLYEVLKETEN